MGSSLDKSSLSDVIAVSKSIRNCCHTFTVFKVAVSKTIVVTVNIYFINIDGFRHVDSRFWLKSSITKFLTSRALQSCLRWAIKASLARTISVILLSGDSILLENMVNWDDSIRCMAVEPRGWSFSMAWQDVLEDTP